MMKNCIKLLATVAVSAGLYMQSGHAALTAITVDGSNNLTSVTLNGTVYNSSSLIGIDVTAYGGSANASSVIVENGGAAPAVGSRAAAFENQRVDNGLLNAQPGLTVNFLAPVVNGAGDDLFLLDYGSADTATFTINGITNNAVTMDTTGLLGANITVTIHGGAAAPTNLTELENNALTTNFNNTSNLNGVGIDLSDYGVANGATITSLSFGTAVGGLDPVYLAAVPEPSTYALLFGGIGLLAGLRRLNKKK